jgi:hypothetical protein
LKIDPPFLSNDEDELLQPGMFFTLEPQMILKDEFTICLASLFQITIPAPACSPKLLLKSLPANIDLHRRAAKFKKKVLPNQPTV